MRSKGRTLLWSWINSNRKVNLYWFIAINISFCCKQLLLLVVFNLITNIKWKIQSNPKGPCTYLQNRLEQFIFFLFYLFFLSLLVPWMVFNFLNYLLHIWPHQKDIRTTIQYNERMKWKRIKHLSTPSATDVTFVSLN